MVWSKEPPPKDRGISFPDKTRPRRRYMTIENSGRALWLSKPDINELKVIPSLQT